MKHDFRLFIGLLLFISLAFLIAQPSHAANRLLVGGWSKHLVSQDVTNSNHKVLGIESHGWSAGYFQNSYGRPTWFVNRAWRWPGLFGIRYLEGVASIGLSYGYRNCWGDRGSHAHTCPDGIVGISWTQYRVIPSIKIKGDAVVFQPEIRF